MNDKTEGLTTFELKVLKKKLQKQQRFVKSINTYDRLQEDINVIDKRLYE